MCVTVLLVGVEDPEPRIPGVVFVRARPDEIGQAAETGAGILVLGDEALKDCNPRAVKRMLRRRRRIVILSPVRTGCCRILAWGSEGFHRAAPPGGLAQAVRDALAELNAGLVRPRLGPRDWCKVPPSPGSLAEQALLAVPDLRCLHSVQEWCEALDWPYPTLYRVCRAAFGVPPREVLFWYLDAVVRCTSDGSEEDLATLCGYSSASSLSHAYENRGLKIPAGRVRVEE